MHPSHRSRRNFLLASVAGSLLAGRVTAAAPGIEVLETKVISVDPGVYHGWPTVCRRRNGRLILVWSGGRQAHVCPFGRVDLMTSDDGGETWSWPRTLIDGAIDDRDAGVVETAAGTLLVTTFTSLAYESILKGNTLSADRAAAWKAVHQRLSADERRAELGVWMLRSVDGGRSWSERIYVPVNSPHGPILLRDGRLLYPGKDLWREGTWVGVCESTDDGRSWKRLAEIKPRTGDKHTEYHELHGVEAADGRIIVHIRNHNPTNAGETLQCESTDGGRTFSEPHSIGVWGLPSHLLRLRDGRLLMTYGHRRPPFGNQCRLSTDHGRTWSDPIVISADGAGGDLGYPSTVELDDGGLVTIWYELLRDNRQAVLRQAKWRWKS